MNASRDRLTRKPYAGNPHVRFEEGEGSLLDPLYSTENPLSSVTTGGHGLSPLLNHSTRQMLPSASQARQRSKVLLASVMFKLIDDDGADDDAAFDDLLEVSRNVGQVEDVIQHADNESADDGAGNSADTAG